MRTIMKEYQKSSCYNWWNFWWIPYNFWWHWWSKYL